MKLEETILNKGVYEEILGATEGVGADFTNGLVKMIQNNAILHKVEVHEWLMIAQLHSWFCSEDELTMEQFYAGIIYPLIQNGKVELVQKFKETNRKIDVGSFAIKYINKGGTL